ncbi:MAG TPA: hypothetical protein VMD30_12070 [Tepidisphaeraceae bacterium]|nr:hypothetical protein [Tepidisphaeraceae bacterium]
MQPRTSRHYAILLLLLILAVVLRVPGIFSQPWLDEIFSLRYARHISGPLGVFTQIHSDNNHYLNTLYLYLVRSQRSWWSYRLLSLATGIGTVFLGLLWARRWGKTQAIAAAVLLGFSEFLIEYSSDARGYAPAGFFAMAALLLLDRLMSEPSKLAAAALGVCWSLAILSHLAESLAWIAMSASLYFAWRKIKGDRRRRGALLIANAIPVAALAILYAVDLRRLVIAGGPPQKGNLSFETAGMILGIVPGWAAVTVGAMVLAICVIQIGRLFGAAKPIWIFFAIMLAPVPLLLVLTPHGQYVHPRYLYPQVPFIFLLLSMFIGQRLTAGKWRRMAGAAALAAFAAVNIVTLTPFLAGGRGDYLGIVNLLARQSSAGEVSVCCPDFPAATPVVLQYYWRWSGQRRPLAVRLAEERPQWMVIEQNASPRIKTRRGDYYRWVADFPTHSAVSGISMSVYDLEH